MDLFIVKKAAVAPKKDFRSFMKDKKAIAEKMKESSDVMVKDKVMDE